MFFWRCLPELQYKDHRKRSRFRIPSEIFMCETWNFRIIERNIKAIFNEYFSSLCLDLGKIFKIMTFSHGPRTTYCTLIFHQTAPITKSEINKRYSRLCTTTDHYNIIHHLYTLRLTSLDHPRQLISEHSFSWITCSARQQRLKNKQADDITRPVVYYKTSYNREKPTDKLVSNILCKYYNPYIT